MSKLGPLTLAFLGSALLAQADSPTAVHAPKVDWAMPSAWEQVEGCARRIAIAEPEHPYVVGCDDDNDDDNQFYRLNNSGKFVPIAGKGESVEPSPDGDPSYSGITANHQVIWPMLPNWTSDIPCTRETASGRSAADPSVSWLWRIGCDVLADGVNFPISRRISNATTPSGTPLGGSNIDRSFESYPGGAVRIAAGLTDAVAWVVNAPQTGGGIYRQTYCNSHDADESLDPHNAFCKNIQPGWEQIPGCATSIANGGRNRVWVIGCDKNEKGEGAIYQYAGASDATFASERWTKRAGHAKEIAVDWNGRPWAVKADGTIWRWRLDVPAKGQRLDSDPQQPGGRNPN